MPSRTLQGLLALSAWLLAMPAGACSCAAIAMESLVDQAETILVVRVVRIEDAMSASGKSVWVRYPDEAPPYSEASSYGLRAEYKVLRQLKQTGPMPAMLRTGYGGGDCGIGLEPGSNYLILTDAIGGVSMCSGSRKIGFQDGISCQMQAYLAAVERRVVGGGGEVVWPSKDAGDSPLAIDQKVSDSLKAGRSAFEAGCDVPPLGGSALQ